MTELSSGVLSLLVQRVRLVSLREASVRAKQLSVDLDLIFNDDPRGGQRRVYARAIRDSRLTDNYATIYRSPIYCIKNMAT